MIITNASMAKISKLLENNNLGVKLWNFLDSEIKQSKTIYSFKSKYEYYINIKSSQICC